MELTRVLTSEQIREIVQSGCVKITLTPEEMREAYLEEKASYLLADAEAQFMDFVHFCFGPVIHDITDQKFIERYGVSMKSIRDASSPHYMLKKFADAYEKRHDCNDADNDIWQAVIEDLLNEYSKGLTLRCAHCGYAYSDETAVFCPICGESLISKEKEKELMSRIIGINSPFNPVGGLLPKVIYDKEGVFFDPKSQSLVYAELEGDTIISVRPIIPVAIIDLDADGQSVIVEDNLQTYAGNDFCGQADDLSCYAYFRFGKEA